MTLNDLLSSVDSEIAVLRQARALLTGSASPAAKAGRPSGKRKTMSAEARARIGAATRARWAAGKMGKQSQSRLKKAAKRSAKKAA